MPRAEVVFRGEIGPEQAGPSRMACWSAARCSAHGSRRAALHHESGMCRGGGAPRISSALARRGTAVGRLILLIMFEEDRVRDRRYRNNSRQRTGLHDRDRMARSASNERLAQVALARGFVSGRNPDNQVACLLDKSPASCH